MKTIKACVFNWADMEQFGIIHLTGEADRLNLRGLFDLTEEGRKLFLSFFNLPEDTVLRPNINTTGVANVAIPYTLLTDLAVAGFSESGHRLILIYNGVGSYVMGVNPNADEEKDLKPFLESNADKFKVIRLS